MIHNYLPLLLFGENAIETNGLVTDDVQAKFRGYVKKWTQYSYLASIYLFFKVLRLTAHTSYIMQSQSSLVTDITEKVKETKEKLEELKEIEEELPFESHVDENENLIITVEGTNRPLKQAYLEKHQMTEKQKRKFRKYNHVVREDYKVNNVANGKKVVKKIKDDLITAIINKLTERYQSFEQPVIVAMKLCDHTLWDHTDPNQMVDKIKILAGHFEVPLSKHNFSMEKAIMEFRDLKRLANRNYSSFKYNTLFCSFFSIIFRL